MAGGTYKNFILLLRNWPLDKSKKGKDLAQHIREEITCAFAKGESQIIDKQKCDRYYNSLQRLSSNYYLEKYKRSLNSTSCGLSTNYCNALLSEELQTYFVEGEKGFYPGSEQNILSTFNVNIGKCKYSKQSYEAQEAQLVPDPVMYNEVLQYLDLLPGSTIIDMTFGSGGHSAKILEAYPDVKIFALDRDPMAYECAQKLSEQYPNRVIPLLGRFSDLPQLLKEHNILANSIDAFFFDFGCSSMQLEDINRGFSLLNDGPLDMRMDGCRNPKEPTAADVLESIDELDLIRLLKTYGGEKRAKTIARTIIEMRSNFKCIKTTKDLSRVLESIVGAFAIDNLSLQSHTAAKTFQALRIFVNNELNEIDYGILLAQTYLKKNGKLITIAYTTLEDIVVKQHLKGRIIDNPYNKLHLKYSDYNKIYDDIDLSEVISVPWKMLHKHVLIATEDELEMNPLSRNAKLRALEKIF